MLTHVSRQFRAAVKLAEVPAWRIAASAGVNPNVLSKIMSGALRVHWGDKRVLRVAEILGLSPDECFIVPKEGRETAEGGYG